MKKVIRLFAIAAVAMSLTVACNNNKNAEAEDTTAIEQFVEDTTDTIESVAEQIAENIEEPVKQAVKTAENEVKQVVDETKSNVNVDNANTNMTSGRGTKKAEASTKDEPAQSTTVNVDNANTSMTSGRRKK